MSYIHYVCLNRRPPWCGAKGKLMSLGPGDSSNRRQSAGSGVSSQDLGVVTSRHMTGKPTTRVRLDTAGCLALLFGWHVDKCQTDSSVTLINSSIRSHVDISTEDVYTGTVSFACLFVWSLAFMDPLVNLRSQASGRAARAAKGAQVGRSRDAASLLPSFRN